MKRRKYTYNLVIRETSLNPIFELLTYKELQRCSPHPQTKKVSVYSDKIYYFFGVRFALYNSAAELADEINAHALGILKRHGVKPECLTPELRHALTERVKFDLRGLSAEDTPEVITNIIQNL